ncbi:MAG TPA: Crp/Fnr family transcriptional regulator [Terriglobales bacterium]|nr:Crp/Fnr family transcriptional regulator [Terriglobales bacterium]
MAVSSNIPVDRPLPQAKPAPLQEGMRTDPAGKAVRNVILLAMPDEEYDLIRPHLELIEFSRHHVMHEQGEKIEFAYFPNEGMVSLVILAKGGKSVEVGLVGKEGMIGTPLAVGVQRGPYRAIVQIPGSGLRLAANTLETILPLTPEFKSHLNRYILVQGLQIAQVAACNRLHELDQRLARWLLMCQDRVDSEWISLTHEFLAQMLGTGRPSVTLAAGMLERTGAIENTRGTIRVLNRKDLEKAACECYDVIQNFNGGLGLR